MTEAEYGVIDAYVSIPGLITPGQNAFLDMVSFLVTGHESQGRLGTHLYYKENNPQ